jgi:hypothetical protein
MANGWSMGLRDSEDEDEDGSATERVRPHHGAPDNELPVTVPIDQLLAATDDIAIYLSAMSVYTLGAAFTVEVRAHPRWRSAVEGDVWDSIHGHGRGSDRLLLGVEYADGRRCSNLAGLFGSGNGVSLWPGGSSGGGRSASADWYLSPLPPPGDLRIYCAWPGAGVDETRTVLDASTILEAASRVRELWPWEPERHEPSRRVHPTVPEGGWFASLAESGA